MPSIVDPAEGEFRRLRGRTDALQQELADAPDRTARRRIKRELRRERLRVGWQIARIRWRNRATPW